MKLLLLAAILVPLKLAAADFCAVSVNVIGGAGPRAPVALIDKDGKVEASVVATLGTAVFCDIGFGPHTIRVGDPNCPGYVTIHNVSLIYGFSQTFSALWEGCKNLNMMSLPPSCQIAFRVTSLDGAKLSEAEVHTEGGEATEHADSYGRFFKLIPNGSAKKFTFSAPGYAESDVSVTCNKFENIEKAVQMSPR